MADHLGSQDAHGGLAACAHARPRWTGDDFRAHEKQFDCGLGMRLEIAQRLVETLKRFIPKPSCGSGALGLVLFTGAPAEGLFLYRGFKFVW